VNRLLPLLLGLAACQDVVVGEGQSQAADPASLAEVCRDVGEGLCEAACACTDGERCSIAIAFEGGTSTINWSSPSECYTAYATLGCTAPTQSLSYLKRCAGAIADARCGEVPSTEGPRQVLMMPALCDNLGASGVECGASHCASASSGEPPDEPCCLGTGEPTCAEPPATCSADDLALYCDGPEDCPGSRACCADETGSFCSEDSFCDPPQLELCHNDKHCLADDICRTQDFAGHSYRACVLASN
jgi:hypothetical protein